MCGSRVPWSSHCLIGLSTCTNVTQTLHDDPDDDLGLSVGVTGLNLLFGGQSRNNVYVIQDTSRPSFLGLYSIVNFVLQARNVKRARNEVINIVQLYISACTIQQWWLFLQSLLHHLVCDHPLPPVHHEGGLPLDTDTEETPCS